MKKVSIIIPYYNTYLYLLPCIYNIIENTIYPNYEIIIVNDGSEDFSAAKRFIKSIKNKYNIEIKYIDRKENKLFAYTCNEGAHMAKGELLHFLNVDTIPQKGWLKALVELYEEKEEIGAVGSMLIFPKLNLVQHIGGEINEKNKPFHIYKYTPIDLPFLKRKRKVSYISGASMLVSRQDFWEVGGFDDKEIRHTYEDTDLCFKLRKYLGKELWVNPVSKIFHYENVTSETKKFVDSSYEILKKRWKKYLKDTRGLVFEEDGFSKELIFFLTERNIGNFSFSCYLIKKYNLKDIKKQRKFLQRNDVLEILKKEISFFITSGKYPIFNELVAISLLRTSLLSNEAKRITIAKLIEFFEKKDFFKNLYNIGSLFALKEKIKEAEVALNLLLEFKEYLKNDLVGRVYYKLSTIESNLNKKINLLEKALLNIPGHKKAKKEIEELYNLFSKRDS